MNLQQIKDAVERGQVVNCKSALYEVRSVMGKWVIVFTPNGYRQPLTWNDDGKTLNGQFADFYIKGVVPPLAPRDGGWAVVRIRDGVAVCEMFRGDENIHKLNFEKYRAVPIGEYLAYLNYREQTA